MLLERVAQPSGRPLERTLERLVGERLDLAAVVADQVVMVVVIGPGGLEAGDAVARFDALDEAELGEGVEGAIDARHAGGAAGGGDPVVDLLRRATAVLLPEVLDHRASRPAATEPCRTELVESEVPPRLHLQTIAILIACYARVPCFRESFSCVSSRPSRRRPPAAAAAAQGKDAIVAAFYPLAYAAAQVAGPDAEVVNLTPPGAEPHDLELTPREVGRVRDARLAVYAGAGFQPAMQHAVEGRKGPSVDVLDGVDLLQARDGEGLDPHVWLDPVRYAAIVREIAAALGTPAAAHGLVARLQSLDREYRRGLARCKRRQIVTSHAAFGYLAARYGLEQVPLVGLQPEAEPGPRDVARLVDDVRATGATTVFAETLASPALADTVAREAGVATAVLDPLEGLTSAEVDAGADYFTVMRTNLAALRRALGCR